MTQGPWRVLGGPLGAHTSARSAGLRPLAALAVALTAVPMLLALALRSWCLLNGFGGQAPLWRACYSDLPTMLSTLRLGAATGEPVVPATVLRVLAELAPGVDARGQAVFVLLWALVALVLLAVCAVAITAYRSDRVLLFVLSPVLALGLLISGDLVGVTLMVVGVVAWHLRHDVAAGAALALAGFSRGVALVVIVAVVILAVRVGRPLRRLLISLAATAAMVVALTLALAGPAALTEPLLGWWRAVPSYGSLWVVPAVAGTSSSGIPSLTRILEVIGSAVVSAPVMTATSLVGWALAIALLWWLARQPFRPSVADLALVGVAVVLLTAPAIPVQASLWLVPLAAMSSLPRRDVLIWAGAEILYFPMVWLYLGGLENADRGLPGAWYVLVLALRVGAIAYLVWRVVENARYGPPLPRVLAGPGAADVDREFAPRTAQRVPL